MDSIISLPRLEWAGMPLWSSPIFSWFIHNIFPFVCCFIHRRITWLPPKARNQREWCNLEDADYPDHSVPSKEWGGCNMKPHSFFCSHIYTFHASTYRISYILMSIYPYMAHAIYTFQISIRILYMTPWRSRNLSKKRTWVLLVYFIIIFVNSPQSYYDSSHQYNYPSNNH